MHPDLKKQQGRRQAVTIQMVGGYLDRAVIIVQGFLLIPLYLSFIGERMYGLWLASGGILAWLGFMDMGLGSVLIQRVSDAYGRKEYARAAEFFLNGFLVFCILGGVFFLIVLGVSFFIPGWFGAVDNEITILKLCFQLAGITAAAEFMNNCLRGFAQALQRPLVPMLGTLTFRIIGLAATILLLYHDYYLWSIPIGLIIAVIPSMLINGVYAIILFRGIDGACKIRKDCLLDFMRLGPSLFASKLGSSMVNGIEPTLITLILKPELAPAFVITRRAADMVHQIMSVIMASVFPGVAHLYAEGDAKKFRGVIASILAVSFGGAVIGFGVYMAGNQAFVALWTGPDQSLGELVSLSMALGLMTLFLRQLLSLFLIGLGDIQFASIMNLAEAVCRLVLMVGLFYGFGLIGLPLGMLFSCTVFGLILWRRFNYKAPAAPSQHPSLLSPLVFFVLTFASGYMASLYFSRIDTWVGFGLYLSAPVGVYTLAALVMVPGLKSECLILLAPIFKRLKTAYIHH